MTSAQQTTVRQLEAQGFSVLLEARKIVRMTKGADKRIVHADGTQKRAYHVDMRTNR